MQLPYSDVLDIAHFSRLFDNKSEYLSYETMWEYPRIHIEFEKCAREHLNNQEIRQKLYQEGLSEREFSNHLEEILSPVYQSAKSMGFSNWSLKG